MHHLQPQTLNVVIINFSAWISRIGLFTEVHRWAATIWLRRRERKWRWKLIGTASCIRGWCRRRRRHSQCWRLSSRHNGKTRTPSSWSSATIWLIKSKATSCSLDFMQANTNTLKHILTIKITLRPVFVCFVIFYQFLVTLQFPIIFDNLFLINFWVNSRFYTYILLKI